MSNWELNLTAPNGATGHLVLDAGINVQHAADQIAAFLVNVREHDPEPESPPAGSAAQLQPLKQAKSQR